MRTSRRTIIGSRVLTFVLAGFAWGEGTNNPQSGVPYQGATPYQANTRYQARIPNQVAAVNPVGALNYVEGLDHAARCEFDYIALRPLPREVSMIVRATLVE